MGIESSNRSPSPMSFQQNPNPNFANSRNHTEKRGEGGMRRSACGSPFSKPSVVAHPSAWCSNSKSTSANSLTEHGRRNSFSKETATMGLSRDLNEHKENKKPNPSLKPQKGSKNFMSPTISAISKVAPSPRKKALAERNEAVRTSASLSDGKFLFFAAAGEDDLEAETKNCEFQKEFHKKEETPVSTCEAKKRVTFDDDVVVLSPEKELHRKEETPASTCEAKKRVKFDDDVVVLSPEVMSGYGADEPSELYNVAEMIRSIGFAENVQKEEPFLDISKTGIVSSSPSIAPLDADPCAVPPYDPKTNYLSPRPQFLRYKPPEKDALCLNNFHLKNLEDTFTSETYSDNDMESTVEEVQSEEISVDEDEAVGSASSSSSTVEEAAESSDESTQAHEGEISVGSGNDTSAASEIVLKTTGFFRRRITWILLFGTVALLSSMIISHAPPENVLFKVYHQYNQPIYEFVKADFSGSLHRMRTWSITYLPLMISSFKEPDEFTPSEFLNFSALVCDANDHFVERKAPVEFLKENRNILPVETKMDSTSEEMALSQSSKLSSPDVQHIEQTGQVELDYSSQDQFIRNGVPPSHPEIESPPNLEADHEEVEVQSSNPQIEEAELPRSNDPQIEEAELPRSVDLELEPDSKAKEQLANENVAEQAHLIEPIEDENEVGLDDLEEPSSYKAVVEFGETKVPFLGNPSAVRLLVAALCVATAFTALAMFAKSKRAADIKSISTGQAEMSVRKEDSFYGNPSHGSRMEAETYNPSEMSSYSFSYKKEASGGESEAQSRGEERRQQPRRNYKRESLASSSSEYTKDSASYGSFTTYSIRPTRNGDEEFVTPVRRSSRIRQQLSSP